MKTSDFGKLNYRDLVKGLIVAALSAALTGIKQVLDANSLNFNWQSIAITATSAALAYLIKNFFTGAQTITQHKN